MVTSRPVRVRLTHLIRTFLVKNSADKKLSGQVGEQLIEYHILLQEVLDPSSDCNSKQGMVKMEDDCWELSVFVILS